ncbi:MAG: SLATT domain-containing protein, partial [Acidimicrobiales bacterium]
SNDTQGPEVLLLEIPSDTPASVTPVAEEVSRLHEDVLWSAQGQFEQMKFWRAMNVLLGVPAAVLAALSGGTGLAATKLTATPAVLALVAAGFAAALTTLNPSRRVSLAQAAANAYLDLQTDARQLLVIDLKGLSENSARESLGKLTSRRSEVNRTADPPGVYAYWRASSNIKRDRQTHQVDRARKNA